jgi:hypothetical protein
MREKRKQEQFSDERRSGIQEKGASPRGQTQLLSMVMLFKFYLVCSSMRSPLPGHSASL